VITEAGFGSAATFHRGVPGNTSWCLEVLPEIKNRKSASIADVYLKQILPCELMDRVRQIYYFIKIEDKAANRRKIQIGN